MSMLRLVRQAPAWGAPGTLLPLCGRVGRVQKSRSNHRCQLALDEEAFCLLIGEHLCPFFSPS